MFHKRGKSYCLLLMFVVLCSFNAIAQKTKVLVIPFPENHFFSSISIQEIADANERVQANEIPQFFIDNLLSFLEEDHWKYDLIQIPENELEALRFFINPMFVAEPTGHYGVDFSKITDNISFKNICESYNIDRVLFLTHYSIQNKLLSINQPIEGSFMISWTRHLIDYEYYSLEGDLIALADKFDVKPGNPSEANYLEKGLNINSLKRGFRSMIIDISKKETLFSKKKKPIYKLKKKK